MNILKTHIEGVLVFEPTLSKDTRGCFYESFRENEYGKYCDKFQQDNISISYKNVLRGLHYSKYQAQIVTIVYGKIWDVVVDLRPDSKTFKQYFSIGLDSDNPKQVYMPKGCAHGIYVQSDVAVISYKCSKYYDLNDNLSILWNDKDLNINWPITASPNLSEKDLKGECFSDVDF